MDRGRPDDGGRGKAPLLDSRTARLRRQGRPARHARLRYRAAQDRVVDQVVAIAGLSRPTRVLLPRLNIPPRTRASSSFGTGLVWIDTRPSRIAAQIESASRSAKTSE